MCDRSYTNNEHKVEKHQDVHTFVNSKRREQSHVIVIKLIRCTPSNPWGLN